MPIAAAMIAAEPVATASCANAFGVTWSASSAAA
jgi:hypothetical protein